MALRSILPPLAALLVLTSCVPVIIAGAVAGGAAVGVDSQKEGGIGQAGTDIRIRSSINDKWFKYNTETFRKLHLSVDQGRVLITGIVQNPDDRVAAVRLAWQVDDVTQVINEIQIADSQSFGSYAQDKWITTRIRTELTFEKDVKSTNFTIDTVNGNVYLMGIYWDQEELDDVIGICRDTPHVKQVVSYVKKLGAPIPDSAAGHKPSAPAEEDHGSRPPPAIDDSQGDSGPAAAPPEPLGGVQRDTLQPQPVEKQDLH